MSLKVVTPSLSALDSLQGVDALALFIGEEERPLTGAAGFADWRLLGGLSRVLLDSFFLGAAGDALLLPTQSRLNVSRVFAFGLGKQSAWDSDALDKAFKDAAAALNKALVTSVAVGLPEALAARPTTRARFEQAFVSECKASPCTLLAARPAAS